MNNYATPKLRPSLGFWISVGMLLLAQANAVAQTFYVSPSGNDNNPGTIDQPLLTLEAARNHCNAASGTAATIYLRGGVYPRTQQFYLTPDYWNASKSLVISSYNNEAVTISGGKLLDPSKMSRVTDPAILKRLSPQAASQVYVTSLSAQQIADPGTLHQFGYGHAQAFPADELFSGDQPLQLARAPNSGKLPIGTLSSSGGVGDGGTNGAVFQFSYGPAASWSANKDTWVSGWFNVGWSDETVPVTSISGGTIKLGASTIYGVQSSIASATNNTRDQLAIRGFYFLNVLDALDTVGEYYIDRTSNLLYFWPPSPIANIAVTLSTLTQPLFYITDLSNITFNGIKFAYTRGCAIQTGNVSHVTITNDQFNDLGLAAIIADNATYWTVDQCKFFNVGSTGIAITGGNRTTLTSSGNVIKNSEFAFDGRLYHSFNPPISINGVGTVVSNCYFHDLAGQAILFQGNNHLIVNNHISNVCFGFSDMGALGTGRDPSSTGTLIINNYFEDISCSPDLLVNAIYIDDGSGGIKVHSNLFRNCGTGGFEPGTYGMGAIHINGGADNELLNNIFINSRIAISGNAWDAKTWSTYLTSATIQQVTLQTVNILSSVYQQQYPWLKDFFNANRVRTNTISNSVARNVPMILSSNFSTYSNLDSSTNTTLKNASSWSAIESYFQSTGISPNARAWLSWTPISFDAIGPKPD
jgi:Right handed beta helix region